MTNSFSAPREYPNDLPTFLANRFQPRMPLLDSRKPQVIRLLNGYTEGLPGVVVDLFSDHLVISDHSNPDASTQQLVQQVVQTAQECIPWLKAVLLKQRKSTREEERRGIWLLKAEEIHEVVENGIRFAIDLRLNQDESFYPDTCLLRSWLKDHSAGMRVLNTFAYTGSLGIAVLAGGAKQVIQTDLNSRFLSLATKSYQLNHFEGSHHTLALDFFSAMQRFKTANRLFDCVILDPPFFSTTSSGQVDLSGDWISLINKARPLVGHEGILVLVNNSLFVSGEEVMRQVSDLCSHGYLTIETKIDVPQYCIGYPNTMVGNPLIDPKPFVHSTKIVVLRVNRKDRRRAESSG